MLASVLSIPFDFERRESVRLLGRKMGGMGPPECLTQGFVVATALRIWLDWAQARKEFRPLRCRLSNDKPDIDWKKEDLTYVIEGAAEWRQESGSLMAACLDAGFMRTECRDDQTGLVLDGFWELNHHLSPDYQTIQRRGGLAAAAKRAAKDAEKLAAQRRDVFDKQGILPFGSLEVTKDEEERCYALFIRLYRVCGLSELPSGDKFTEFSMRNALNVVRTFDNEQISEVEEFLLTNRDNPEVVKMPERILEHFGVYAEKAGVV